MKSNAMNLPKDLVKFLSSGQDLEYDPDFCECGAISLHSLDSLELSVVWLDTSTAKEQSYIEIPAISLIKECEGYDPKHILSWFPNERVYGSWDCDHWKLLIYPDIRWVDIVKDPLLYIGGQWEEYFENYAMNYRPIDKYPKIIGWPF